MFLLSKAYALPRRPMQPLLSRGKRYRRPKKGVMVRLLQDVPEVGRAGTVMEMDKVVMRAWLFPARQAEYILRPKGGYRPEDLMSYDLSQLSREPEPEVAPAVARPFEPEQPSLLHVLPILQNLPPLVFRRRPISPSSKAIFGSVTRANILSLLENEHNIALKDANVELTGDIVDLGRIKQLGRATCRISIPDVGETELPVIVHAQGTDLDADFAEEGTAEVVDQAEVDPAVVDPTLPAETPMGGETRTQESQ